MQQRAMIAARGRAVPTRWWPRLAGLGSVHLTLWLIGLLALGVAAVHLDPGPPGWTVALPLAALALNLAGAIAVHPALRTQAALLAFHVALLVVVLLAAASRLTYLKGTLELSDGVEFDGVLVSEERGPLHDRVLGRVTFASLGYSVHYEPELQRARTRNRVSYGDARGVRRETVIGDDTPLRLSGYRFYTTPNKGYAPEVVWIPADRSAASRGTVHLPSFPAQLARQETRWTPPGAARALTLRLELEERIVDLEGRWTLRLPRSHTLRVRASAGEDDVLLRPGDTHRFRDGTLHYAGLRMWMGYKVYYDWSLPWMLAAAALAACALGWHFVAKFARAPWQRPAQDGAA